MPGSIRSGRSSQREHARLRQSRRACGSRPAVANGAPRTRRYGRPGSSRNWRRCRAARAAPVSVTPTSSSSSRASAVTQRLAPFDAAAGKPPARPIAVPHQQHAAFGVDHRALRAEREPTPHAPERPEHRGQQSVGPEPSEQGGFRSCRLLHHGPFATSSSRRCSNSHEVHYRVLRGPRMPRELEHFQGS